MGKTRILALILAGGSGGRLDVLTQKRAKPATPDAGTYTLIDFPLSNCLHSGISDVWVVQQYQPHSLSDHLANGRPWDLDRTFGGLRILHPHTGDEGGGWHQGTADAVYRNAGLIRETDPLVVLALSADHVYTLDYAQVVDRHLEVDADVTMVTTRVDPQVAARFGLVRTDDEGRVTDYAYKPDEPISDLAATEVFVFRTSALLGELDDIAEAARAAADGEQVPPLEDFGDELLPRRVRRGTAWEHRLPGYWPDMGTVDSYWQGHMDLLGPEPAVRLSDPQWPILTLGARLPPARIFGDARIDNSLLAPGCVIHGTVEHSVLAAHVEVAPDTVVRDSVLLQGARICTGAVVESAIVDVEAVVSDGARVGAPAPTGRPVSPEDIAMVGQGARVASESTVAPGARVDAR